MQRLHRARQFVRALDLTLEQKQEALAVAEASRGLERGHKREILPQVRALLATLSPEQHERLEQLAQRHGRTFDQTRVERRLGFLLSRPGAAERLRRHLPH
ncbi:MAG: hypothetical protein IPJ19_20845 [Planctomycetes bacterium]|nr:hypothetical protein [Planctomycetota bacterium]